MSMSASIATTANETVPTTSGCDELVWKGVELAVERLDRTEECVFEVRLGFGLVTHAPVRQVDFVGEQATRLGQTSSAARPGHLPEPGSDRVESASRGRVDLHKWERQ
jgi:hypothetical protein